MPGPTGPNVCNWDTYSTANPPPAKPAVQVWINPADSTPGPAQPSILGGASHTGQAYPDTYFLTTASTGIVPNDGAGTVAIQTETI
jgi:hypothetical protein